MERAFLQIELHERDRDVVRFLWYDGPIKEKEMNEISIYRFTRVPFGVTSSPFLLTATIKHHIAKYRDEFPIACRLLEEHLYVDDLIGGTNTEDEALVVSQDVQHILREAGMKTRKWRSNSETLNKQWELQEDRYENENGTTIETSKQTDSKVLGIKWDSRRDEFYFDTTPLLSFLKEKRNTKRFVLMSAGRIFDPVGLITPFTIRVKFLFQEIWIAGTEWDESLPENIQQKWDKWCLELKELSSLRISRYYFASVDAPSEIQIHCFTDASEKGYGAVIYLRIETGNGSIRTVLVCSKSRVRPLKQISLPRLELMGALLGARLSKKILNCLCMEVSNNYFWTDSTIVLCWIKGSSHVFKPFVSNRVAEIQTLTEPSEWHHCPGVENPADYITRGMSAVNLIENAAWWRGPTWLSQEKEMWPKRPQTTTENDEIQTEMRPKYVEEISLLNVEKGIRTTELNVNKYSSFWRLVRVTSWILRFIFNTQRKSEKRTGCLNSDELIAAERFLIKCAQEDEFGYEMACLRNGKEILRDKSAIYDLSPIIDEHELLRVGGRLQHSENSFASKHPLLLPTKSKLTELIISQQHKRAMHGGIADTLSHVRQRFWIPKGRQVVKGIIGKCLTCKKYNATPGAEKAAPLPTERIVQTPPFQTSAVDFAGPLYIKSKDGTEKTYVALFTCAVTRAVHLELVTNLSTDKFLMAMKRFISRRGRCKIIFSDNAKTFQRANKELNEVSKLMRNERLQNFLGERGIKWKFIVERAPFWGGFWERLIRSMKTCMRKILSRALLSYEEMVTLLTEIEGKMNARPITYTYSDAGEPEPLTPNHFLIDGYSNINPTEEMPILNSTRDELTKRKRYRQLLLNRVWQRWKEQYLCELRTAHHVNHPAKSKEIKLNDVVLINEEGKPKMLWKIGVVTAAFKGRDGRVRSCCVRTAAGTILKRPIQLLYPLELQDAPIKPEDSSGNE